MSITNKEKWVIFLGTMLKKYRKDHPNDKRSDKEVLHLLMGIFFEGGFIDIDPDTGKYKVGDLTI